MKKIIAILLCLCTLCPMLVACGGTETTPTYTPTGSTVTPGTTASTKDTMTEQGIEANLDAGTYEFKHTASGSVLGTNDKGDITPNGENGVLSVDWKLWQGKPVYRIGLFGTRVVKDENTNTEYNNQEVLKSLGVTQNAKTLKEADNSISSPTNHWVLLKNDDGTYYIRSNIKSMYYLSYADGEFQMIKGTDDDGKLLDITPHKWTITDKSEDNPFYCEFKSDDKHIVVRLHKNVFDESNYTPIRVAGEPVKSYAPTKETIIEYANSISKIKDVYTDLCGFEPYNIIIIHAYNYAQYMAYVIQDLDNNNVWVNAAPGAWYYEDLQEVQYRKEVLGLKDCGFVMLHEIGHMYDTNREWNFETEMLADLKAAYFLSTNPDYVAAPSEFNYDKYLTGENIVGADGFGSWQLGGGKMTASDDETKANYSIYRNAEINSEICQNIGWEHLRSTFRWFTQDTEGKKWRSKCNGDRMDKFYEKLSEFSGKNTIEMIDKVELGEIWKKIDKDHQKHLEERNDSSEE